ncbi:hypothetical protein F5X71_09460 [Nocardia brasiliensis]|uniref:Uncharacterized protein n=2 Tax=Nocardia brasiliensis TaxID=37326 RepID=A0A6G9Y269_NOCBR|nr:hypothetical protein F5X71_09460 [Nocardia brasiliensis]
MANILTEAREGRLAIELKAEDFVYIDRDCEYFKDAIQKIQRTMDLVAQQDHWGLGEANDLMVSASTLVGRFKEKANGAKDGNSVYAIMEMHYKIAEDIQEVHRLVRERMMQADSTFASDINRLNESLPQRPPAQLPAGPYLLPDGTAR